MSPLSPITQQAIATVGLLCVIFTSRQLYNYSSGLFMSDYRDKSALFGRELKPGEPPSWPWTLLWYIIYNILVVF